MSMEATPESEKRLTAALQSWAVNDPLPPGFQERVWQRIATVEAERQSPFLIRSLRAVTALLTRPKVAYTYVTILLALGVAAGTLTAQMQSHRTEAALGSRYVQIIDPYQTADAQ